MKAIAPMFVGFLGILLLVACSKEQDAAKQNSPIEQQGSGTNLVPPVPGQEWGYRDAPKSFGGTLRIVESRADTPCGQIYLIQVRDLDQPGRWFQVWVSESALKLSATDLRANNVETSTDLSPGSDNASIFEPRCATLGETVSAVLSRRDALRGGWQTVG